MKRPTLTLAMLLLTACGGGSGAVPPEPPPPPPTYLVAGDVGPAGGVVEITDPASPYRGVAVDVPAGALAQSTSIEIYLVEEELPGGLPLRFRFEPAGLQSAVPMTVRIKYEEATLAAWGITPDSLSVLHEEAGGDSTFLPSSSLDSANRLVSSVTTSFSIFSAITKCYLHLGNSVFLSPRAWLDDCGAAHGEAGEGRTEFSIGRTKFGESFWNSSSVTCPPEIGPAL